MLKKQRLLLRTAREQIYAKKLTSFTNDIKWNWKVLNSLMGKKTALQGVCCWLNNVSCSYFVEHPRIIMNLLRPAPPTIWIRYKLMREQCISDMPR